jgi:TatD DNase family protein
LVVNEMKPPNPGQYIDIHTHGGTPSEEVFIIESLMAHEGRNPEDIPDIACTYGIHPWHLSHETYKDLLNRVRNSVSGSNIVAVGEAGFDRLRGATVDLQHKAFNEQISISEEICKPVVIHCVRAWDELLSAHKKLRPAMPWLIHGFRGSIELAGQLLSKGFYLSFWFDFVVRPESSALLKILPADRIFLETDGADVDIRDIYKKVATDLEISVDELKAIMLNNFNFFYKKI